MQNRKEGGVCLWQVEAVALHASSVLLNHVLAVGLRVGGVGEEHAFVAGSLLILADTAWLWRMVRLWICIWVCEVMSYLDLCGGFALGLEVGSEVVGAYDCGRCCNRSETGRKQSHGAGNIR